MSNLMQFVRQTHVQLLKEEADVQLYNCQNSWGDNLSQLVVRHWEQTTCCRNAPILKCESNNEIHWDPGWCSRWIWWLMSRQEEFYLLNCISQIFQIFIPSGSTDLVREHVTVTGGFYESTNLCICTALPLRQKKTFIRNIDLNFQGNLSNMQICWMKIFADWKRMPSSQF